MFVTPKLSQSPLSLVFCRFKMSHQPPDPPTSIAEELCKIRIRTVSGSRPDRPGTLSDVTEVDLKTFLSDSYGLDRLGYHGYQPDPDFIWIHIPMNNMQWVEVSGNPTVSTTLKAEINMLGSSNASRSALKASRDTRLSKAFCWTHLTGP
jgi:hypothetical protein